MESAEMTTDVINNKLVNIDIALEKPNYVTSDRGSSASPSIEEVPPEEEKKTALTPTKKESKIPIISLGGEQNNKKIKKASTKKATAPKPPITVVSYSNYIF